MKWGFLVKSNEDQRVSNKCSDWKKYIHGYNEPHSMQLIRWSRANYVFKCLLVSIVGKVRHFTALCQFWSATYVINPPYEVSFRAQFDRSDAIYSQIDSEYLNFKVNWYLHCLRRMSEKMDLVSHTVVVFFFFFGKKFQLKTLRLSGSLFRYLCYPTSWLSCNAIVRHRSATKMYVERRE